MIADLYDMSLVRSQYTAPVLCLKPMLQHILGMYIRYRANVERKQGTTSNPKRIIFYRGRWRH